MKGWGNIKLSIIIAFLLLGLTVQAQSDQDDLNDMQNQMLELQKQMEHMMRGFSQGDDIGNFFFSDTLMFNDFGDFPMDSLMKGFSFAFPGMDSDSMMMPGFDLNGGMFGGDFQDQLNQMFRSLDDISPEFFMDMEELQRQLEQNGIRPDDPNQAPVKPGKKKKKVYKI